MTYITPGGRAGDARPLGKGKGPRGLTDYTRAIARALMRKHPEWTLSHAIAVARNAQKRWEADPDTSPAVKAGAAASLAAQSVLDHRKRGRKADLSNPVVSASDGPGIGALMASRPDMLTPVARRKVAKRLARRKGK